MFVDATWERSLFNSDKQRLVTHLRPRRRLCLNTALRLLPPSRRRLIRRSLCNTKILQEFNDPELNVEVSVTQI